MPPTRVRLRLPATSANLGPGFDCLGLALDLWSEATLSIRDPNARQPSGPFQQMALDAVRAFYQKARLPQPPGLTFDWQNGFPIARGLGASAAVRAAALLGANAVAGNPLDVEDLLTIGAALEDHADNITPAFLGGFQVALWEDGPVFHASVPVPDGLKVILIIPEHTTSTDESRKRLVSSVPRGHAVYNVAHVALLVAALASQRLDLLRVAMNDRLHQPARAQAMPYLFPVIDAAKDKGALGAYLSGSGSTVAAWTLDNEDAVADAMLRAAAECGYPAEQVVTKPSAAGARVLSTE
jgi:homoserine kinase